MEYKDLAVRSVFEIASQRRLDQYHILEIPSEEEKVFRVNEAIENDLMKMQPNGPKRQGTYRHEDFQWNDVSQEEAERLVINGQSLLVLGIAGTGKSTFVKKLVESLKQLKKQVDIISKTHCASERINGVTADHYARRHILNGSCNADTIWIDEISQLEHDLWCHLNKLKERQWLLSGDFNQFAPIWNSYRGCEIKANSFENSRFLYILSGGNRLTLTECRRSEQDLFDFYSSLIQGGKRWNIPLSD